MSGTAGPNHDLGDYKSRYDGEIRYLDGQVGRLLAAIEKSEFGPRTLVALTADHGESLGEHDYYLEHGRYSYQANAHVPLILFRPGLIQGGGVVE